MEGNEESAEIRARAMAAFEELGLDTDGSEETLRGLWSRKMKDVGGAKRMQGTRGFGLDDLKDIPKQSRSDAREGMKQEAEEFEPGALGDLVPGTRMRPEKTTPGYEPTLDSNGNRGLTQFLPLSDISRCAQTLQYQCNIRGLNVSFRHCERQSQWLST